MKPDRGEKLARSLLLYDEQHPPRIRGTGLETFLIDDRIVALFTS